MWKLYRKIRSILNGLLLMEVMLGAVIIAVAATYHSKLSSFMTQAERTMISTKLAHAYILGFQLIALYLGSLIMWKRIWLRRYSQSIQLLLKVWLFFCSLLAICSCATMWSLLEGEKVVGESVEMLLQRGIDAYYTNPEWKFLWDQLQYKQECCGVNGYMDWMRAAWMPRSTSTTTSIPKDYQYFDYETELNEETQYPHTIMEKKSANRAATELPKAPLDRGFTQGEQILAPYACCKHHNPSCYPKNLLENKESPSLSQLNISDINTRSCLSLFNDYLWYFMRILLLLVSMGIVTDIFLCCLTKYYLRYCQATACQDLKHGMSMYDDDGNAVVIIKCPPKVKCITLEETNSCDSDFPNICTDSEPCCCCYDSGSDCGSDRLLAGCAGENSHIQ